MNYYHVDGVSILSGPHAAQSTYVKKLTSCGNPELLDLSRYGLVHEVVPAFDPQTQRLNGFVVYPDRVERSVEPLTPEEMAANLSAEKAAGKSIVKALRDAILKGFSEKLVIYGPNYDAAREVLAGNGATFIMQNGQTAAAFAEANAAAMGFPSANAWAGYIANEWQVAGGVVAAMELEYLRLYYNAQSGIDTLADKATIDTAVGGFVSTFGG